MRRTVRAAVLAAAVAGVFGTSITPRILWAAEPPANQPATAQAQVPVKQVVLFSSGVGYFEHFGTVTGSGSTELSFKSAQINDILKSLVLQDMDKGRITTITYPSQDPVAKTLRSFQVDITNNPSLHDLLNQLRGARVKLILNGQEASGTILGVERKERPVGEGDKGPVTEVWVLNLIDGASIRPVPMDDVRDIQIQDPQLRDELGKALQALAQARDQDKKPITINFQGQGERRIRVGYVVETPIWKTSYRLVLDDAGGAGGAVGGATTKPAAPGQGGAAPAVGSGKLQGWAIVENQTDNDWNDVQLSLISGRPISFIQDLYQPLYVPRPVVQPELYASLRPQTYDGGMNKLAELSDFAGLKDGTDKAERESTGERKLQEQTRFARRSANAAAANAPAENRPVGGVTSLASDAKGLGYMDATGSIASVASAAKVGELFQYTVGSVSLPRQKSAMIPIITDPLEVERLSIYNAAVLPKNPLNGARVKNTTQKHLLQGPITVLEGGSYAGDARIDNLPPGQERLISYGIDLQTLVQSQNQKQESSLLTGKIVKGVLQLTRKNIASQDYVAENKGDRAKTLVIEHPRRGNEWKLVEPAKPGETTDALYRFKGGLEPGKPTKLTVREERVTGQQIAILPMDLGQLDFYRKAGEIPKDVKDALIKAAGLKGALVDTQRQITERQQKTNEITQEQNRLRDNMKTVAQNTDYYNRLLKKLGDQETQIEKLQQEVQALQKTQEQQRKELEDYLGSLTVG